MSTLTRNCILQGLSGKLGGIVFRQFRGKTIVQASPVRTAPFRPGELENQQNFRQAITYAREARQNPELWALYITEAKRRGGTSNANAVAVSDYLTGFPLAKAQQALKPKKKKVNLKGKRAATAFLYTVGLQSSLIPVYCLPEIDISRIYHNQLRQVAASQAKVPRSEVLPQKVPRRGCLVKEGKLGKFFIPDPGH